jgi:hypothetical protein
MIVIPGDAGANVNVVKPRDFFKGNKFTRGTSAACFHVGAVFFKRHFVFSFLAIGY